MGYGDLSHTEVIISHEAKLSGIYETEVWDKSHILWQVIGQVFYSGVGDIISLGLVFGRSMSKKMFST